MAIVKCGGCGMILQVNDRHAQVQIFNHRVTCKAYKWPESENVKRSIGAYLNKVQKRYE